MTGYAIPFAGMAYFYYEVLYENSPVKPSGGLLQLCCPR